MGLTLDSLRKRSQEAGRFDVVLDEDWLADISAVYTELDRDPEGKRERELREQAAELEGRRGDAVATFKLRRLSNEEYESLLTAHPPTQATRDQEDADGVPGFQRSSWDKETFIPAFLVAAVTSPALSEADVKELRGGLLAHNEYYRLFTTALALTTGQVTTAPPAR